MELAVSARQYGDVEGRCIERGEIVGVSNDLEPLDEISDALGLTIEYVEDAIEDVKAAIQELVREERFAEIERRTQYLKDLRSFNDDITRLLGRWASGLTTGQAGVGSTDEHAPARNRRKLRRVKRGTKTPQTAFREPILRVLAEAGGSMPASDCLDVVGRLLADDFKRVDHEYLPSDQRTPRWRNTAQWCRNDLADEGLIDRSVRGVWTITPLGREWLAKRDRDS